MIKYLLIPIVTLLISSSLSSCATTDSDLTQAANEERPRHNDCISQSSIRDYQVLDESNLIVTATARRKYHLVLSRRAYGLRSAWNLNFRSQTGRICAPFSEIIIDERLGIERIGIASIRRLYDDDLDDLLIRFGKKEPKIEQTAAPVKVEGAEVEELD